MAKCSIETPTFTHLHVHSNHSMCDGLAKIPELFERAHALGMKGLALTDHGVMTGVPDFISCAKRYPDIKPIVGCECYLTDHIEHTVRQRGYSHLILLAKNATGYRNLVKLCSIASTEGRYYRPRISHRLLEQYHEGLICSSACIGGEISRALLDDDYAKARSAALWYKSLFGEDFYLEVWRHKAGKRTAISPFDNRDAFLKSNRKLVALQEKAVRGILRLGAELSIKVIATNDVHFVRREDAIAQDVLLCHSYRKQIGDPDRIRYSHMEYLRSEGEMRQLFRGHPEVIDNTQEILDKVERYSIQPDIRLPELSAHPDEDLEKALEEGAPKRYGALSEPVRSRLNDEMAIIKAKGLSNYFLFLKEIIDWARAEDIWMGPGRSDGASSTVAYCLGITNVDPISNGLLYERLLCKGTPEDIRIDLDIERDGKEKLFAHLQERYGVDSVSQMLYMDKGRPKQWMQNAAAVFGIPSKTIKPILDHIVFCEYDSLLSSLQHVPGIQQMAQTDERINAAYQAALRLEGTPLWNSSVYGGVVVARGALSDHLPVGFKKERVSGKRILTTQYSHGMFRRYNYRYQAVMPLCVLSLLKETSKLIRERYHKVIDYAALPLDDPAAMGVYTKKDTVGVFEFDCKLWAHSPAVETISFSDLVALIAIYRPSLLRRAGTFFARQKGSESIPYLIPALEPILGETYGLLIYQEQVMRIAQEIALFSREQSEFLRRALWKPSLSDQLPALRQAFLEGGTARGHDREALGRVWTLMETDGRVAFLKAHAVSYARLSFACAWLKAHYPMEFLESLLAISHDEESITLCLKDAEKHGVHLERS